MSASLTITVREVGFRDGRYIAKHAAFLDSRLLCESRTPFLSAARVLMARGIAAETALVMKREGSDVVSLVSTVAEAARWAVREDDERGPEFVAYRPFPLDGPAPCHGIAQDGHEDGSGQPYLRGRMTASQLLPRQGCPLSATGTRVHQSARVGGGGDFF